MNIRFLSLAITSLSLVVTGSTPVCAQTPIYKSIPLDCGGCSSPLLIHPGNANEIWLARARTGSTGLLWRSLDGGSSGNYRSYRLNVTQNNGELYRTQLAEFELY